MGTWPRTVSTPPPGDKWVPGLGQYLPLLQVMNGTRPRTVSTPPTGDEWVPGLGQYLPLLQEMNGYLAKDSIYPSYRS